MSVRVFTEEINRGRKKSLNVVNTNPKGQVSRQDKKAPLNPIADNHNSLPRVSFVSHVAHWQFCPVCYVIAYNTKFTDGNFHMTDDKNSNNCSPMCLLLVHP